MTNLEKALKQLGYSNFRVIIDGDLCDYTKTGVTTQANFDSEEAERHYYNSVEWTLDDGRISMSPSDYL